MEDTLDKWYEKALRYGQTNLTEIDPEVCDLAFWRQFWEKTGTQAIIVNAGGIVAYYPSRFKNHYRAAKLGGRDLFGDFVAEGRKAGLSVLARMDINRATRELYDERPEWFARHKDGSPFIAQGRYLSCLNSAYYKEYIPEILQEIIERYHPDGFTDNSWTGISRKSICYCDNCKRGFKEFSGADLPDAADYSEPRYRRWIEWSYRCRIDNWDLFNRVTAAHGGSDCLWLGMVNANFVSGHASFCDLREVAKRSKIIMVDHQGRDGNGFEQNSLNGLLLHQIAGWDKIIPESMASYVRGLQTYRRAAAPPLELELWMLEGIAGGITPWWHIVGAVHEDRRIYDRCVPVMQWHRQNEEYLYNRSPVANVGIVWNQRNVEFYGGAMAEDRVERSWRGIVMALTRAGIPFLPINADDIASQSRDIDLLILPELGVVSPEQVKSLEQFGAGRGSVFGIGAMGIMESGGSPRSASALEGLMGIHFDQTDGVDLRADPSWENPVLHNYLRIEKKDSPVFKGFDHTDILPMGGTLRNISAGPDTSVLASYIPVFPIYPPEFAWTETTHTGRPVITECALSGGGRAVYAAWDLDSSYGRTALPDQGDLLGNIIQYLLKDRIPVKVECGAYIDFKCYRQGRRLIIHLINLNHTGFAQGYAEKIVPVGPVRINIRIPGFSCSKIRTAAGDEPVRLTSTPESCVVELDRLEVHQLLILE
jgi:hypothetical protein